MQTKRVSFCAIVAAMTCTAGAMCASLLTPTEFPKTINDISMSDRMANLEAGYEPFKDAQAYLAIQLESVHDAIEREIEELEKEHELYCLREGRGKPECNDNPVIPPEPPQGDPNGETNNGNGETNNGNGQNNGTPPKQQTPPITPPKTGKTNNKPAPPLSSTPGTYCSKRHPEIPQGQKWPFGVPISTTLPDYKKGRENGLPGWFNVKRASNVYHQGVDISCCKPEYVGEPIFAIADGVVRSVQPATACKSSGNMISITHENGIISYYMHLNSIYVKKGQTVYAGCMIGTMGHTGGPRHKHCPVMDAKMTHLHYELRHNSCNGKGGTNATYNKYTTTFTFPNGQVVHPQCNKGAFDPNEFFKYKY